MAACSKTRDDKCDGCTLTGPTTLVPGAEGTWVDGKTNSGEWQDGSVKLKSRTFEGGYTATMPTGGEGPFKVRVCYGEDERTCCEAQVDFPACSLSGPSSLNPGVESLYTPSAGMEGASCVCSGDMELVRTQEYSGLATGFVCRMKSNGCEGKVTVMYGGRECGHVDVRNPLKDYQGSVVGPSSLPAGETAIFYHDLGKGATYTGTLPGTPFENELGNGIIGTMPANATPEALFKISFDGPCNSKASKTISSTLNCANIFTCEGVNYCVGPMTSIDIDCIRRDKNSSTCSYPEIVTDPCIVSGGVYERRVFTYVRNPWTCYEWYTFNCEFYPIIAVL